MSRSQSIPTNLPGTFKSVQRGVLSILDTFSSASVTISSVDPSKAEVRLLGSSNSGGASTNACLIALINATTIQASRPASLGTTNVSWEVTENY